MFEVDSVGLDLITSFEGAPRLKARRCEGDAWELGWGSTYWPDGRKVREGETCAPSQAEEMLAHCLKTEAGPVWRALEFTPNQYQVNALAALSYNVGGYAAATSSVVKYMNAGRFEDAAEAFGLWTGATTVWEPGLNDVRVVSPSGEPCEYFRRLRGLLRREYATGCVSLGYDWSDACANDAIMMRTERRWNAAKGRWQDYVIAKTEFKEVLEIARLHPLPSVEAAQPETEDGAGPAETSAAPVPDDGPELGYSDAFPDPTPPVSIPVESAPPEAATAPVAQKEGADMADTTTETKHPLQSITVWGGIIAMLLPQFEAFGQMLQALSGLEGMSGAFAQFMSTLAGVLTIVGRFGATKALTPAAQK